MNEKLTEEEAKEIYEDLQADYYLSVIENI